MSYTEYANQKHASGQSYAEYANNKVNNRPDYTNYGGVTVVQQQQSSYYSKTTIYAAANTQFVDESGNVYYCSEKDTATPELNWWQKAIYNNTTVNSNGFSNSSGTIDADPSSSKYSFEVSDSKSFTKFLLAMGASIAVDAKGAEISAELAVLCASGTIASAGATALVAISALEVFASSVTHATGDVSTLIAGVEKYKNGKTFVVNFAPASNSTSDIFSWLITGPISIS